MPKSRAQRMMNACFGKKRYESVRQAMAKARELQDTALGAYHCSFCRNWHLGHAPKGYKPPLCHDDTDY